MCTINPMEISSLNISLYGLIANAGAPTFDFLEGGAGDGGKVILGLFLKKHK